MVLVINDQFESYVSFRDFPSNSFKPRREGIGINGNDNTWSRAVHWLDLPQCIGFRQLEYMNVPQQNFACWCRDIAVSQH